MTRAALALILCAAPALAATDDTGLTIDEWRAMVCAPDGSYLTDRVSVPPVTPIGNPLAPAGLWSGGWIDLAAGLPAQHPLPPTQTPAPAPPPARVPILGTLWLIALPLALLTAATIWKRRTR